MLFIQKHAYITLAEVLTVLVMFALVSNSLAQNSPWVRKANMQKKTLNGFLFEEQAAYSRVA